MKTLFTISLLELFIGGGGRLLQVGPVTVRMILFVAFLSMGLIFASLRLRKYDGVPLATGLIALYLLIHMNALLIGAIKGHELNIMMGELKPTLYWLAAPFLALVLRSHNLVLRAAMLVRVAGMVLAVGYIGIVALLALGLIDPSTLYTTLNATGEFKFRSESLFFYKGFLYLCIAAIFFLAIPKRFSAVWSMIVIIALIMTITRGFLLSTSFAVLMLLTAQRRWRLLGLALAGVACATFFLWAYMPSQNEIIAVNREVSNIQRIEDFSYIVNNIKISALLFGEGFGTLINGRINIENTFLWAIWKLGIAGVLFWLLPLVLCLNYFARINRHSPQYRLACAYFFSTVFVYLQTMTNPYLNNPIGLSFVLVSVFSLRTLSKLVPAPICLSYRALGSAVPTNAARETP